MKKDIINIGNRLFIPICTILICYFLFNEELITLSFINYIRYFILLLLGILGLSVFFELTNNKKKRIQSPIRRKKLSVIYFYSEYIVNYSFYIYFSVYMIFMLDKKSIVYNYILLILYGIFIGYRIAVMSHLKKGEDR